MIWRGDRHQQGARPSATAEARTLRCLLQPIGDRWAEKGSGCASYLLCDPRDTGATHLSVGPVGGVRGCASGGAGFIAQCRPERLTGHALSDDHIGEKMLTVTLATIDGYFALEAGEEAELSIVHDPQRRWFGDSVLWLTREVPGGLDDDDVYLEVGKAEELPDVVVTDIVAIAGAEPLRVVSAPTSYHTATELCPPGRYLVGISEVPGRQLRAVIASQSSEALKAMLAAATAPSFDDSVRQPVIRDVLVDEEAFLRIADHILNIAQITSRSASPQPSLKNAVLANVVVPIEANEAIDQWRDLDTAWIFDSVNRLSDAPETFELVHSPALGSDVTLCLHLTPVEAVEAAQIRFEVEYFALHNAAARRWKYALDEKRLLTVSVGAEGEGRARCIVMQDAVPERLKAPLGDLWSHLTSRING